jgi:sulfate transport system substrate-binding protein
MRHSSAHRPARRVALVRAAAVLAVGVVPAFPLLAAGPTLLNVSYDVAREFFKEINPAFSGRGSSRPGKTSRSTSRTAARASRHAQC